MMVLLAFSLDIFEVMKAPDKFIHVMTTQEYTQLQLMTIAVIQRFCLLNFIIRWCTVNAINT